MSWRPWQFCIWWEDGARLGCKKYFKFLLRIGIYFVTGSLFLYKKSVNYNSSNKKEKNYHTNASLHSSLTWTCVSTATNKHHVVPIGCFRDFHEPKLADRPLPKMIGNHRGSINWHNMSTTVTQCAADALAGGYHVFGVQFYGECWSGRLGYKTYDQDGFSRRGCWSGVGKSRNNYVYAFTGVWISLNIQLKSTMIQLNWDSTRWEDFNYLW